MGGYTFSPGSFEFTFGVPKPLNEPMFAKALEWEKSAPDVMGKCLMAWWLAMLLFAVAWGAFIGWSWRRMKGDGSASS